MTVRILLALGLLDIILLLILLYEIVWEKILDARSIGD